MFGKIKRTTRIEEIYFQTQMNAGTMLPEVKHGGLLNLKTKNMQPQKFQSGDKAKVLSPTMRTDFLKHVLQVGSVVEIAGLFTPESNRGYSKRAWGNIEAYVIKGSTEILLAEELETISIPVVEPQYEGDGKDRYNIDTEKLYTVRRVHMQDLKDDDYFWTNRQGGGFINARVNKLRGKEYDNLVVLVLAFTPNEVQK